MSNEEKIARLTAAVNGLQSVQLPASYQNLTAMRGSLSLIMEVVDSLQKEHDAMPRVSKDNQGQT